MMYDYFESGLDNVFLLGGFEWHETDYGSGVTINDPEGLNKAIIRMIIGNPQRITGQQFRFLRGALDMSQRQIGDTLNENTQNIKRWEKARDDAIPSGSADRLLRIIVKENVDGVSSAVTFIQDLNQLDDIEANKIYFDIIGDTWSVSEPDEIEEAVSSVLWDHDSKGDEFNVVCSGVFADLKLNAGPLVAVPYNLPTCKHNVPDDPKLRTITCYALNQLRDRRRQKSDNWSDWSDLHQSIQAD